MIKDQQYWKDYNQKRKEYIRQKNRERYLKNKGINTTPIIQPSINTTQSLKVNEINTTDHLGTINTTPQSEIIQPKEQLTQLIQLLGLINTTKPNNTTTKELIQLKLWKDYYHCKKPFCSGCWQKGIPDTAYAFCSLAKDASDPNFKNIYQCQVYHWTIYQGKGNQSKSKPLPPIE